MFVLIEIAMREKSVVDRTKHVVRWKSDAIEIDTEAPTVSETSKRSTSTTTPWIWRGWRSRGVEVDDCGILLFSSK